MSRARATSAGPDYRLEIVGFDGSFASTECIAAMAGAAKATVTIVNRLGLHARPAMCFVEMATESKSSVRVRRGDQEVDGKSIMQMMMLAATRGTQLDIIADGPDAEETIDRLVELVNRGFDEE